MAPRGNGKQDKKSGTCTFTLHSPISLSIARVISPCPCPKLMTALDSRNSKSPWKDCPLYRGRGVISNNKESPRRSHHTVGIRFILCIMLVTTYVVFGPLCRVRLREWSPRSHLDHDGLTICSSCSLPRILFSSDQSSC